MVSFCVGFKSRAGGGTHYGPQSILMTRPGPKNHLERLRPQTRRWNPFYALTEKEFPCYAHFSFIYVNGAHA